MNFDLIASIISIVDLNKYLLVFIIMFLEGPTIAFLAGFSASVGYFNLWIILLLAVLGNLIPDMILYGIGRVFRGSALKKFFVFIGLHNGRIRWLKKNINKHSIKTISLIKLVPPLPLPGLILTGFLKVNFKKFFLIALIFNIIFGSLFVLLGFYSGITVNVILKYLKLGEYVLPLALILGVAVYLLVNFISKKISKKTGK